MKKSIKVDQKKKRGRPPTGRGIMVSSRFPAPVVEAVDDWALKTETTRSDAIRRLVEIALKAETPAKPAGKPGRRSRAAELAADQIEKMIGSSAPSEERDRRKIRLTKGPPEFREERLDQPKAKK
jgi:hypothetical protein